MAEISLAKSHWRAVEVGRVVKLQKTGTIAAIVEIIDHKRVLVDGPASNDKLATPRGAVRLADVLLTPMVLEKLPRGSRTKTVKNRWESQEVESKWAATNWAKKEVQREARRQLTDFERFKLMRLQKQRRFAVRKALRSVA